MNIEISLRHTSESVKLAFGFMLGDQWIVTEKRKLYWTLPKVLKPGDDRITLSNHNTDASISFVDGVITRMLLQGNVKDVVEFSSVQFSSVSQSCPTLCDPMNCSTPGLPVHHQLPEFTQTHVHRVSDAIQPSHPLSSPSPPAPNPSQHQSLFQWVNSLHEVAKGLEFQL